MRKEMMSTIEILQKLHRLNHPDENKRSQINEISSKDKPDTHFTTAFSSPLNRGRLSYFSWLRRLSPPSSHESH